MARTSRTNPEDLKNLNKIEVTEELKSFVTELSRDIDEEINELSRWSQAVDRLDRLRYGVRTKKTHPWLNAANFVIPQIDTDIARLKASYVNLAFNVSPVVTFTPYGPEDVEPARLREELFDWRMRTQVDFFKPYNYGVDLVLGSRGQAVFRTIWKFTTNTYTVTLDLEDFPPQVVDAIFDPRMTDNLLFQVIQEQYRIDLDFDENVEEIQKAVKSFRDGKTKIELVLLEVDEDQPEVTALDVKDDLVIPADTKELNDARFIDYRYWVTKNDLKISMSNGKYEKYDDKDIDSWAGSMQTAGFRTNNITPNDDMVLLHETCAWYDINDDGIKERCIVTWPDAAEQSVLRFIELPYDHGEWPYVQVKREMTGDGFYETRGIPSLIEDFQTGMSTALNQAIDNGTLLNMPERVARKGVISNPRNRRFLPGELTEVNGSITEYETRVHGNAAQPILFQQVQFLKSFADSRLGQLTSNFSSQTDLAGIGERGKKTKAEVDSLVSLQAQAQSLDLMVFQNQMADVYYQIDALYEQFGPEEEYVQITGQQPRRVGRDEIKGRFSIVPNGRLDNATPQQRLQKDIAAYQIGLQNPYVKQKELIEEIFNNIEARLAKTLLKSDEELLQEQQQQAQAIEAQKVQSVQEGVAVRKMSDDLDIRKEVLLTPIQGRKYAPD